MKFSVKSWKDKGVWLAGAEDLDIYSQGKTQKKSLHMLVDAIEEILRSTYKANIKVGLIYSETRSLIHIPDAYASGFFLKRTRQRFGFTQDDVATRLHCNKNAYAQYEQCRRMPTLEQLEKFISVMQDDQYLVISLTKTG